MTPLTVTFEMPAAIAHGLANGTYERVGGVIRDVATKQVVVWLKEHGSEFISTLPIGSMLSSGIGVAFNPITGVLQIGTTLVNTAITKRGFDRVDKQLTQITNELGQIQNVLLMTSAVSILNLSVAGAGFIIISKQLKTLEKRLQDAQEVLDKINRKVDLGFYANFRAALDLASNAFSMGRSENRRNCALQAINRFLEAQHVYTNFVDQELELGSQITDEYILTLCLAYLAETRCYLELEEPDVAYQRFQEGLSVIRSRTRRYIEQLLTSNPAAYLDPQFKQQISLGRLTKVYQWLDPTLDENDVFELHRENLFNLRKEQGIESGYKWVNSLPSAIVAKAEVKGTILGNREETKREAIKRLPQAIEMMESLIETSNRFEMYQMEAKVITKLGLTFHEWLKLSPEEPQPEGANVTCIIPSEPLAL